MATRLLLPCSVQRFCLAAGLLLVSASGAHAADPVAELAAFSVFGSVDLNKLKGDVTTARSPAMSVGRDLSVQSCYVLPMPPAQVLAALQGWDASRHRELKIYVHGDLPAAPSAASFSKLASAPDNGSVRALAALTDKRSQEMQISTEEALKYLPRDFEGNAKPLSEGVQAFWSKVLLARTQAFASGGAAAGPDYGFTGQGIKPGDELASLLRQQEKIRQRFAGFLGESGVLGGRGSLKKDLYYELIDVDDEGVLTLGSFSSKGVAGGGFQAADVSYYASGGYHALLTLYELWPVEVGGQPATLVWRGDLISSASLGALRGVEKLGSESAMMKDVAKTVRLFKGDAAR